MPQTIVYDGPSPARYVPWEGEFRRGVPREVASDATAEKLLTLPGFSKVEPAAASSKVKKGEG